MRRIISLCCAAALVFSLACSDDADPPKTDGPKVGKDGGTPDAPKAEKIDCTKNTCYDYVTNKLILPTDSTESEKYALELNGKKYNSLGGILALIVSQAPTLNIQAEMDGATCEGAALILLRAQAASLTSGATTMQTWVADKKACCTTTSDNTKCCTEAATACFNGTTEFTKTGNTAEYLFGGNISGGKVKAGPASMKLNLTLSGGASLALNLKAVVIKGEITATGIKNGVLSGAIPKDDLDTVVVPQIATMVNTTYKDPKTDQKTIDLLKTLFDTNKDGEITAKEVKENGLIKTFLDGDVDVDPAPKTPATGCKTDADCDTVNSFKTTCSTTPAPGTCIGKKELSLGLGFSTVAAKIK